MLALRPVCGVTDPLAVGHARAIAVDRVAPAFGDGGIETAELVFRRGSVLGPYCLEKLFEPATETTTPRTPPSAAPLGDHRRQSATPTTRVGPPSARRPLLTI